MSDFDFSGMQERIRSTRSARKMSLDDVASASGFTKSHVWELEQGRSRNPTVKAVWGLSRALGVSPAYLLGLDPQESAIDPLALEIAVLIDRRIRGAEIERLREALVWADLKIRSFPRADQSDVEPIRQALKGTGADHG
ncbi:helix-turn-helix domain-containing protein [Caenibius sp. WL]|uniref:helix-turn-helix domain-containing protein n=1 Tax=Caenibius sp. WL TaxID=2872646 RepID=UPI001C99EECA|nr:helix-turn-helix domain-containing protein [Caenibius sp. WL]QZP07806.1 helix-turn-helix domain-containing protein [Caenibius sp. WL]QZP09962.1 helix-turn-helix domain-containing protein [Caenibius sp. WL]